MTRRSLSLCLAASLLGLPLCAQTEPKPAHGIQVSHMDRAAKPSEDFYQYANGAWLKTAKIPADQSSYGTFYEIYERNELLVRDLLEAAAKRGDAVGNFYASAMDEAAIEKAGLAPLASRLKRIQELGDVKGLAQELARLHQEGITGGFAFSVWADDKASLTNIAQLSQDGLGLPDRDYYTKEDEASKTLRDKYRAHMARMFELLGDTREAALKNAATVLALETRLAKASMTVVEKRDPNALYNKMSRTQLQAEAPGFPWESYFRALGLPAAEKQLLVRQPKFLREFARMAKDLPVADWRTYLRWNLINGTASRLSSAFVNEHFDFYGKTLNGSPELSPRWKRAQTATTDAMSQAVGKLFVEKAFSPEAKRKALEMVKNLQAALGDRIRTLEWMSDATKQKALTKLDAFIIKIGYPDTWRDYSRLKVQRGAYLENTLAANRFESERQMAKLGRPVDRQEWLTHPHIVNAFYEPTTNEICFPAGILQPPFFDPEADDACNYGAIGMVIGHEMTHGFDDQGCQYDSNGNLKNWWTESDSKAFAARQDKVVKQFDAFKPFPDLAVNGKLTLGENIADLGGLKIAFEALKKQWAKTGKPGPIDGFTAEQRFFLGYAQGWRELIRPEYLRVLVNTDPHSPSNYRVLGPLSNMPEFFEAFGVPEGAPMRRPAEQRPTIW